MNVDDRKHVAKEAGYVLLSEDDGQEIYGRDDLPSTVEFDGIEWTLHLRDFNLDPVGHQPLGDAGLHPPSPLKRSWNWTPLNSKTGCSRKVHQGQESPDFCAPGYSVVSSCRKTCSFIDQPRNANA